MKRTARKDGALSRQVEIDVCDVCPVVDRVEAAYSR